MHDVDAETLRQSLRMGGGQVQKHIDMCTAAATVE